MLKDYYKILELERNATGKAIKQSFRRLASIYHPDKSCSKKSQEQFHKINEAYQILSNKDKKEEYDLALEFHSKKFPPQIDDQISQDKPNKYFVNFSQYTSILAFAFSMLLVIDYCLPKKAFTEKIQNIETSPDKRFLNQEAETTKRLITASFKIPIPHNLSNGFPVGSSIKIYQTPILSIYTGIERSFKGFKLTAGPHMFKLFLPLVLLLFSSIGTFYRDKAEILVNLGLVNFILLIVTFAIII